jgi:hypothetical protein
VHISVPKVSVPAPVDELNVAKDIDEQFEQLVGFIVCSGAVPLLPFPTHFNLE